MENTASWNTNFNVNYFLIKLLNTKGEKYFQNLL